MKKFLILLTLPGLITFTSCGSGDDENGEEKTKKDSEETASDFSGMEDVDLTEHELPITVKVPQIDVGGAILPYEIIHDEGDFRWVISIGEGGDKFRLIFEIAEGLDDDPIASRKGSFQSFEEVEYLVDEADLLMYKVTNTGDKQIPEQFHVFGTATIDGMLFKIYSDWTVPFKERHAKKMLKTIKSAQMATEEEAA